MPIITRRRTRMLLKTAQIGRLGELLVQMKLLENGIDSAPTTTDSGIDLLALGPVGTRSIQVKTNLRPKPSGGVGRDAVDWWIQFKGQTPQLDLVAFVRYDTQQVWLMTEQEVRTNSQQNPKPDRYHLYFHLSAGQHGKDQHLHTNFDRFLFENRVSTLFGVATVRHLLRN